MKIELFRRKHTRPAKNLNVYLPHLEYELRMLIGANNIIKYLEIVHKTNNVGNEINFFKDSVYLHSRNLYNFFATKSTTNDINIKELDAYPVGSTFDSQLYHTDKWKNPLHAYALHISEKRKSKWRVRNGRDLNEMSGEFTEEIIGLWEKWINSVTDPHIKAQLQESLNVAEKQGGEDVDNSKGSGFKHRYK